MKNFDLENLTDDEILEIYDNVASGGEDEELYIAAYSCTGYPAGTQCIESWCTAGWSSYADARYSYTNSAGENCVEWHATEKPHGNILLYTNATMCNWKVTYCHQEAMLVK